MAELTGEQGRRPDFSTWLPQLPLIAAALILAVPTFLRLGKQVWSLEIGAHGPIVAATGAWLLWRQIPAMRAEAQRGQVWLTFLGVLVSLPIYVFGRAFDLI